MCRLLDATAIPYVSGWGSNMKIVMIPYYVSFLNLAPIFEIQNIKYVD